MGNSRFWLLFVTLNGLVFNNKLLKILKDTLVVTAPDSGAEIIPFLKTWALIPISLVLIRLFYKLSQRFSREQVFYIITGMFLSYFVFFLLVLFPNRELLQSNAFCDDLQLRMPDGLQGLVMVIRHWVLGLFYVMSDMWSTILISLVFWNFAGGAMRIDEAKRFIPLFSFDIAGVLAGAFAVSLTWLAGDNWQQSLSYQVTALVAMGALVMYCFHRFHRENTVPEGRQKAEKKLPWKQRLQFLAREPYFALIGIGVFAYELTDNLIDVVWKDRLHQLCPDPHAFNAYLSWTTMAMGTAGCLIVLGISRFTMQKLSWRANALITPVAVVLLSTVFFTSMGLENLQVTVFIGAIQSCAMQIGKYTFFDNTKELAFMGAAEDERPKGKAYGDAFAARLGKSSSCITHQMLLLSFVTLQRAAPLVGIVVFLAGVVWVWATLRMSDAVEEKLSLRQAMI